MIGTDKYAYTSPLKNIEPISKVMVATLNMVVCISIGSVASNLMTILLFTGVLWKIAHIPLHVIRKMLFVPLMFLLIGALPLCIVKAQSPQTLLWGIAWNHAFYGVSIASLWSGLLLLTKALACTSGIYFLVLTTPMTDFLGALQRLHMPVLLMELMELTYRFIFVFYETAKQMYLAQASRLGYIGWKRSIHSLGELVSMVFLRAYRASDAIYTALSARGYTGKIQTLQPLYQSGKQIYIGSIGLLGMQIFCIWIEGQVKPF